MLKNGSNLDLNHQEIMTAIEEMNLKVETERKITTIVIRMSVALMNTKIETTTTDLNIVLMILEKIRTNTRKI